MVFKRLFAKVLRIPRHLRMIFYIRYNRLKFWLNRVEMGRNMLVYNSVYLNKAPGSSIRIGDDFVFTSGEAFNPLCRNIRGCIYTAPTRLRTFSSVMIRGSRRPAYGLIHLLLLETT